jgi:hypothetical protein
MLNNILQVPLNAQLWYVVLFAWSIVWKGLALWRAAHKEQKWWFMAFLVINTLGILEIIYLYVISVDRKSSARNA